NGTLPGRCFDLKESTAVERVRGGRTEHAFNDSNKTRRELYGKIPEKAIGFAAEGGRVLREIPRLARDSGRRLERTARGVPSIPPQRAPVGRPGVSPVPGGRARRPCPARAACRGRPLAQGAPSRNWCR